MVAAISLLPGRGFDALVARAGSFLRLLSFPHPHIKLAFGVKLTDFLFRQEASRRPSNFLKAPHSILLLLDTTALPRPHREGRLRASLQTALPYRGGRRNVHEASPTEIKPETAKAIRAEVVMSAPGNYRAVERVRGAPIDGARRLYGEELGTAIKPAILRVLCFRRLISFPRFVQTRVTVPSEAFVAAIDQGWAGRSCALT
jgi:hypothetical protein